MIGALRRAKSLLLWYAVFHAFLMTCPHVSAQVGYDALRIGGHDLAVKTVAFSSDGKRLLAQSSSGTMIYDALTGNVCAEIEKPAAQDGTSVFSPDGTSVAAIVRGRLHVYDSGTGKRRFETEHVVSRVGSVLDWSPDGQWIATPGGLLRASSGEVAGRFRSEKGDEVRLSNRLAFSPDSRSVYGIVWSQNQAQAVSCSLPDGLADSTTPKDLVFRTGSPIGAATDFAISPDGRSIALRRGDRVAIQPVEGAGSTPVTFEHHTPDYTPLCMAFSPKGNTLAVAVSGNHKAGLHLTVGFYDVRSGEMLIRIDLNDVQHDIHSIALSPDGSRMAVGLWKDPSVLVFDVATAMKAKRAAAEAAKQAEIDRVADLKQKEADEAATRLALDAKKTEEAKSELAFAENAKPKWADFEDLNALMKGCGAFENAPIEQELTGFVHFGSPENAAKARNGDRFDKEDAKEAAKEHLAGLAKRKFFLQLGKYSWFEHESTNNIVVLWTPSPGCRASTQLHDVVPCDLPASFDAAFLTKDGRLKPAPGLTIQQLEAEGAEVYVPEAAISSGLRVRVRGERDVLKAIAREPDRHVVTIGLTKLRLDAPFRYGWFRLQRLRELGDDAQRIRGSYDAGLDGGDRPNYFVTKERKEVNDREFPPVPCAEIVRIQIVRREPDGRATVVFEEGK